MKRLSYRCKWNLKIDPQYCPLLTVHTADRTLEISLQGNSLEIPMKENVKLHIVTDIKWINHIMSN